LGLLIAFFIAACGSEDDDGNAPVETSDTDICSLVTQAEAEDVLSAEVDTPHEEQESCVYATTDDTVEVRTSLLASPGSTPEEQYEAGFPDSEDVSGLGERARCNDGFVSTLMVLQDDQVLQVVGPTCALAREFAELALSRL
jgi:hypothetical protein